MSLPLWVLVAFGINSACLSFTMNNDPTKATNTQDTGTDGLKFDLPEGQTPGEGLGNGDKGLRDFNSANPAANQSVAEEKAAWNRATDDGEKSEAVSTRDQDNTTV